MAPLIDFAPGWWLSPCHAATERISLTLRCFQAFSQAAAQGELLSLRVELVEILLDDP